MSITPNMALDVADVGDSDYPTTYSTSLNLVDVHDHTAGKGVQIPTGGIVNLAVDSTKLAANSVVTSKILDANVTRAKMVAVGQQVSVSCGIFSTSSMAGVDVTNLAVSITSTGRPIVLELIGVDASASLISLSKLAASASCDIVIQRDATTNVFTYSPTLTATGATSISFPISPRAIGHLDVIGAGTYAYKVRVAVPDGATTLTFNNIRLVAREL